MDNSLHEKLRDLMKSVLQLQELTRQALGFKVTIEYKKVFFHVSGRFVIADLSPLAYVDLVQEIADGDVEAAAANLYERLLPLLECKHQWIGILPGTTDQVFELDRDFAPHGTEIFKCRACTGYGLRSLGVPLPILGRGMLATL